jgi:hypothetical protein
MDDDRDLLIELVTSVWRPAGPDGGPKFHHAWYDLDPADRRVAHDETAKQRALEAALDPDHLSSTARRVLARIRR